MKLLEAVKYLAGSADVGVNNCKICVLWTLLNFHYPETHSKEGAGKEEAEKEEEAAEHTQPESPLWNSHSSMSSAILSSSKI